MRSLAVLACLACGVTVGCTKEIPNTSVPDTPKNREILEFMERYRHAVEARDIGALLAMAHPQYLDDNGTPIGDDDLDFDKLQRKLGRWQERVTDVRYEIKYRRINFEPPRVLVEFRYSASFELAVPDDKDGRWSRRVGDHRIVLTEVPSRDGYLILSGM